MKMRFRKTSMEFHQRSKLTPRIFPYHPAALYNDVCLHSLENPNRFDTEDLEHHIHRNIVHIFTSQTNQRKVNTQRGGRINNSSIFSSKRHGIRVRLTGGNRR